MPHLLQRDSYYVYTQQELKEKLYQEIISYFDKGKVSVCVCVCVCTCAHVFMFGILLNLAPPYFEIYSPRVPVIINLAR